MNWIILWVIYTFTGLLFCIAIDLIALHGERPEDSDLHGEDYITLGYILQNAALSATPVGIAMILIGFLQVIGFSAKWIYRRADKINLVKLKKSYSEEEVAELIRSIETTKPLSTANSKEVNMNLTEKNKPSKKRKYHRNSEEWI